MGYNTNTTGQQTETTTKSADITVVDITARDALNNNLFVVGKQCHVNDNGSGYKQTYYWTGATWADSLLDFVDFNTGATVTPTEGRIGWDTDAQTLTIGLANGVVLQVGQENYIRAKNVSGGTILNGEAVYVVGSSGNRIEVDKAIASNTSATATIAICTETSIGANQNGFFTMIGVVNDLDTSNIDGTLTEGVPIYLSASTAGKLTTLKPDKGNYCVCVGYIVRLSATEGQILVKIDANPKIGDLSDVDLTSLANGDQIYYDSVSDTWKNIDGGFNAVTLWDDIILPAEALGTGASAPDLIFINGSNMRAYGFNGTNTLEQLYGGFELAHTYKEGTDLRPHIHWFPTTTGTGNVKWQLEYIIKNNDEIFTGTSTTIVAIDSADGNAYQNFAVEFDVIDGTDLTIGAQCKFRLFRDPTDAEDTYGADAGLSTLGVHYEIDSDGSRQVFIK